MICARCKTENPAEAKFCMSCGSEILPYCAECEMELPAGAEFCHLCGRKLGADPAAHAAVHGSSATPAPAALAAPDRVTQYIPDELKGKLESARSTGGMEGERRVVTMLFCDVQGSTAAAEQLDPEEWAEIMNGAFKHLIAPVYTYEGTIARLMGDSILAFFGAPIAHEDDPERATLAGLDILEEIEPYRESVKARWGLDFNVRVGINTGLVVVGAVGSDLLVEYTALGDAVNLAARMEQTADPGTVRITDNTHRLIAPLFDFEDLGGIEAKGKSELVQSYRVIAAREERGRLRGIEGLDSPLIGREQEMRSMRAAVSELQQGRGQILSVMGEAGLGKSRLVSELRQALDRESAAGIGADGKAAPIRWCEGRSLSYETATPYAPFTVLLTSCFDLRSELSDDEKYAVLQAQIERVCGEREAGITPYVASLLGIKLPEKVSGRIIYLTPPEMRGHTFRAVAEFIEFLATKQPVILSFEDVHWIDPTSMDLLRELLPITDRAALMIVGAFRPWRNEPSWELHEIGSRDYAHRYVSIMLSPLNSEQSRELVGHLLEVDDLPVSVRTLILARAEGNPFYVEEVIRSLLDAGLIVKEGGRWKATEEIEHISVPDTLAGVITARFDQLSDAARQAAQSAAVIGREFSFDALADLLQEVDSLDEALTDLQRREMIRETRRVPQRVYMFKHALTQETVYNSLLLSKRRELHRRLAECYERQSPDGVEAIARHFMEAGERERALPYVVSSGERAAGAYSTAEAIGHFDQALEILDASEQMASSDLVRRAHEGLGGAQTFGGDIDGAIATYTQMSELAEAAQDVPMQVSAYNKLAFISGIVLGDADKAEALLSKSSSMADAVGDYGGLAEYHVTECYLRTTSGDLEGARDHQTEAQQLGEDQGLETARLFGLAHYANTLAYMAEFDESMKAAEIARAAAEAVGNQQYLAEVMGHILPLNHMRNGDLELAYEVSAEGLKIAQEIGASQELAKAAFTHGMIAAMRGLYEEAIRAHSLSDSTAVAAGLNFLELLAKCGLGTAYADISPRLMDRAAEFHREADEARSKPLGNAFGSMASAEMGFREMKAGNLDEAQRYFDQGLVEPSAAKYLARPALLLGSGFVKMMQGESDEAGRLIGEGREFAEQRGMRHFYPVIEFAEANLLMVQENLGGALDAFLLGEKLASEMGAQPWVWQNQAGAARALDALGRSEDASVKRKEAEQSIEQIGGHFEDEELREHFLEHAISTLA